MSQQERWDVVLEVLSGPQAALGQQVLRGPVVRIGANPGPGGLRLHGYRGLDPRQCVVTAYNGNRVEIAPVGNNQVRMAPHANVRWKDIDPIKGPELMSRGCALHLGPVGRGATLEFADCRRLGEWNKGQLISEVAGPTGSAAGSTMESFDARSVGNVRTSTAPFWFMGCSFLGAASSVLVLASSAFLYVGFRDIAMVGPVEDGFDFYESVKVDEKETLPESLLTGLNAGFDTFVMIPNRMHAGQPDKWTEPAEWDKKFFAHVGKSLQMHVRAWAFFQRLEEVKSEYATVTLMLREEGLPEVFAAIPYQESRYDPGAQSIVCAKGYWQFMPEVAHRVDTTTDIDFKVRNCRFRGSKNRWTPKALAPPRRVYSTGDYMRDERCIIEGCETDARMNLEASTRASIHTLREAWEDENIRASGSAVQLTITSHNAGYDDARYQRGKGFNVKPALARWTKQLGKNAGVSFQGANIKCDSHRRAEGFCGSLLPAEAQHYAYTIVAQHLLAACYYGKNHGSDPAFRPWISFVEKGGYCNQFRIPSKQEVANYKLKRKKKK